jgi:hypothetical protein
MERKTTGCRWHAQCRKQKKVLLRAASETRFCSSLSLSLACSARHKYGKQCNNTSEWHGAVYVVREVLCVSQIIESWSPRISFSRPDSATLTHCTVLELGRSGHFHVESARHSRLSARMQRRAEWVSATNLPPLGAHSTRPPRCHPTPGLPSSTCELWPWQLSVYTFATDFLSDFT